MSNITITAGDKLTDKLLLSLRRLYTSLHRDQLQYLKYLLPPTLRLHILRGMKWFQKPDRSLLFYKEKNNPVGMLAMAPNNTDKLSAYIGSVFVQPLQRGKGIATKLLSKALKLAKRRGLKAIVLGYYANNPASHLYLRFGYRPYLLRVIKLLLKTAAASAKLLEQAARPHYTPDKWQHIKDVLRMAKQFAGRRLSPVLRAAILWHDSAKRDLGAYMHGLNGSKIALRLLPALGYNKNQVKLIVNAIKLHNLDLRIDNQTDMNQRIKHFSSPLALLLALADDYRPFDILPVWKKVLKFHLLRPDSNKVPTYQTPDKLYKHMKNYLDPMRRMPLLRYYRLPFLKSMGNFRKWLDSLTLQLVADRINRYKQTLK